MVYSGASGLRDKPQDLRSNVEPCVYTTAHRGLNEDIDVGEPMAFIEFQGYLHLPRHATQEPDYLDVIEDCIGCISERKLVQEGQAGKG